MNSNLDLYEELETERLILRKVTSDDALDLFNNIYNNFDHYKFYYQHPFSSFSEYQELVNKYHEWYQNGNHFRWGIVLKETNEMIGSIQLHTKNFINNNCKIGYIIGYKYINNGFAKEAVKKVLDFGLNKVKFHRIEAHIVSENIPSIGVAKSVGMIYESTKKESYKVCGKYYNQDVYVVINKQN